MHKIKIKRVAKLLHSFSVSHDYISGVTTTGERGADRARDEGTKIITGNRGLESTEEEREREETREERGGSAQRRRDEKRFRRSNANSPGSEPPRGFSPSMVSLLQPTLGPLVRRSSGMTSLCTASTNPPTSDSIA